MTLPTAIAGPYANRCFTDAACISCRAPAGAREAIASSPRSNRFAYGPAIAVGTFVALAVR